MKVTLANDDPFENNFRVTDTNDGNAEIFNGHIGGNQEIEIECIENGSGYGNLITYQDNNRGIGRSFLKDGDRISL